MLAGADRSAGCVNLFSTGSQWTIFIAKSIPLWTIKHSSGQWASHSSCAYVHNKIQFDAIITQSIFPKFSQKTPHSSPVRVRYGVSFVDSNSDLHYSDAIMGTMASQITGISIACSTVGSEADQRKHQSSASLAFVRGIHQWLMNSPHKGPVTGKCVHLMTSSYAAVI